MSRFAHPLPTCVRALLTHSSSPQRCGPVSTWTRRRFTRCAFVNGIYVISCCSQCLCMHVCMCVYACIYEMYVMYVCDMEAVTLRTFQSWSRGQAVCDVLIRSREHVYSTVIIAGCVRFTAHAHISRHVVYMPPQVRFLGLGLWGLAHVFFRRPVVVFFFLSATTGV